MFTTLALVSILTSIGSAPALPIATLDVAVNRPTHRISPMLYGLFFEEINFAGDGGLCAELVRNGSFEDGDKPDHWQAVGDAKIEVVRTDPIGAKNPRSLRIEVADKGGVANLGYLGVAVKRGESYSLSFKARMERGSGALELSLETADGKLLGRAFTHGAGTGWDTYSAKIKATGSDPNARIAIKADWPCVFRIDSVSLVPAKTWKNHGLRPDLAGMLDALKPSFLRFPGGCWVEGDTMATSQRWKQTVGPVFERRTQQNLWGYMSGNALGFHEYLQFCEDLKAEPLFVINCGMSHREVVPMEKMDEFVQDALDAIEYANGPVGSRWGGLRARNGHPKPFGLKYMEIGNENGGAAYSERYVLFVKAIRAKNPEMNLIACDWGGTPKGAPVQIVDEHYYNTPQFFMDNADKYDSYDRSGPKVYVGEYAVTNGCGAGNLIAALGEAAFMTGMERNSDVVIMASYAPLLAHVGKKAWNPDLINFDSTRAYGIPSYYVQKLFSENRGDFVLPVKVSPTVHEMPAIKSGGVSVGTWRTQAEFKDVRVTHDDRVLFESADGSALTPAGGTWEVANGANRQTSTVEGAQAVAGAQDWSEYTLTLKARKISGDEGFLIGFGRRDDQNYLWWNLGGWGNSRTAIEHQTGTGRRELGRSVPLKVEIGRWYEVRIKFEQQRVRCYLDGKLIQEATCPEPRTVFATASRVDKTGEVVIKVVNTAALPINLTTRLNGLPNRALAGFADCITGLPDDENSLQHPYKVKPIRRAVTFAGPEFGYEFPAYSVTVLRLRAR